MNVLRAFLIAAALVIAAPAAAQAGTVTHVTASNTLQSATASGENISMRTEAGAVVFESSVATTTSTCTQLDPNSVACLFSPLIVARMLAGDDNVDARGVTDSAALQAFGGAGSDNLDGTANGDSLNGEDGNDSINGYEGNDTLDGGGAGDYLSDGPGNDTILGGTGDDVWIGGTGADSFAGGDGADGADYRARSASVTITLLGGVADDGEAGEGDFVGADVESAYGGSGNDTIRGNDLGGYLIGGSGNDTITAGKAEDRVEGNEGDDVIDTRDGRFDSIDCGPGNDTLFADPGDSAQGCEIAPDPDGDGSLAPADCAPNDPAIHPGAGEIVGNTIDEDCNAGPLYLRVVAPVSFGVKSRKSPAAARFAKLVIDEVRAGDKLLITCKGGKKKGCPFASKTVTGKSGQRRINVGTLLKNRYLSKGVVLELRLTRPLEIGRVQRFTVQSKGKVKSELLCLGVGATRPARCA